MPGDLMVFANPTIDYVLIDRTIEPENLAASARHLSCWPFNSITMPSFVLTYQFAVITIHRYYLAVKKRSRSAVFMNVFLAFRAGCMRHSLIALFSPLGDVDD